MVPIIGIGSASTRRFRTCPVRAAFAQYNARKQASDGSYTATGTVRVNGCRVGASGQLAKGWIAGYALLDAKIIDGIAVGTQGMVPSNAPKHSASLWTTCEFAPHWELGGGTSYQSSRFANNTDLVQVGGYARFDATLTLFLGDTADYDGGELQMQDQYGTHSVKLAAGDMVVYPATSLHQVTPIARGTWLACFFWVQSLVRDDGQRALLFDLDNAIQRLNQTGADADARRTLVGCYHNLMRQWSDTR